MKLQRFNTVGFHAYNASLLCLELLTSQWSSESNILHCSLERMFALVVTRKSVSNDTLLKERLTTVQIKLSRKVYETTAMVEANSALMLR